MGSSGKLLIEENRSNLRLVRISRPSLDTGIVPESLTVRASNEGSTSNIPMSHNSINFNTSLLGVTLSFHLTLNIKH